MAGNHRSGRKQYSPEVHRKIIEALTAGAFRAHAARYAGIHPGTLTTWLADGEQGREPFAKLYEDVEYAIAQDAVRNQMIISHAAAGKVKVGDWKAAAWNLEKKHPKLYGHLAELDALRKLEQKRQRLMGERPHSPWKTPDEATAGRRLDS